jgi:pimeloyl-ACP methyl ester carboxylesterase
MFFLETIYGNVCYCSKKNQKKSSMKLVYFVLIIMAVNTSSIAQESKGYAPVNGFKMYFEIYGSGGIPLVLIHGGGSTIQTTFGRIIHMMAGQQKLIAVELQAHGHTPDRGTPTSFEQDADDVAALLSYLKIEKADFFGFSNGGNTAMQIAIRHPEMVNKLVVASSFYQKIGMIPGFFDGFDKVTLENMPAPYQSAFLAIDSDRKHLQTMFERDRDRMANFRDWSDDDLRSIKAPVLFIGADHDVVTPEHTAKMASLVPDARLMILPGTHGSYIGEVYANIEGSQIPELTVRVIEEFLKK